MTLAMEIRHVCWNSNPEAQLSARKISSLAATRPPYLVASLPQSILDLSVTRHHASNTDRHVPHGYQSDPLIPNATFVNLRILTRVANPLPSDHITMPENSSLISTYVLIAAEAPRALRRECKALKPVRRSPISACICH
jgi:hypothetical protein